VAGAIGKPVWLLLPLCPDWRWLLPWGDASPWYPTMRLYRQRKLGDWPDVVARVAADLGKLAATHVGAANAEAAATPTSTR
jgi:hypothetical protein